VEKAIEAFDEDFAPWGLHLPADDARALRPGQLVAGGWSVLYDFGTDNVGPYLDYYASLREGADPRVLDDWHVRLYASGERQVFPPVLEAYLYSRDPVPDELERARKPYLDSIAALTPSPAAPAPAPAAADDDPWNDLRAIAESELPAERLFERAAHSATNDDDVAHALDQFLAAPPAPEVAYEPEREALEPAEEPEGGGLAAMLASFEAESTPAPEPIVEPEPEPDPIADFATLAADDDASTPPEPTATPSLDSIAANLDSELTFADAWAADTNLTSVGRSDELSAAGVISLGGDETTADDTIDNVIGDALANAESTTDDTGWGFGIVELEPSELLDPDYTVDPPKLDVPAARPIAASSAPTPAPAPEPEPEPEAERVAEPEPEPVEPMSFELSNDTTYDLPILPTEPTADTTPVEPEPVSLIDPEPEPPKKPESKTGPKPLAKPRPTTSPKGMPKFEPKTGPRAVAPKPEPKSAPKPAAKTAAKAESRFVSKGEPIVVAPPPPAPKAEPVAVPEPELAPTPEVELQPEPETTAAEETAPTTPAPAPAPPAPAPTSAPAPAVSKRTPKPPPVPAGLDLYFPEEEDRDHSPADAEPISGRPASQTRLDPIPEPRSNDDVQFLPIWRRNPMILRGAIAAAAVIVILAVVVVLRSTHSSSPAPTAAAEPTRAARTTSSSNAPPPDAALDTSTTTSAQQPSPAQADTTPTQAATGPLHQPAPREVDGVPTIPDLPTVSANTGSSRANTSANPSANPSTNPSANASANSSTPATATNTNANTNAVEDAARPVGPGSLPPIQRTESHPFSAGPPRTRTTFPATPEPSTP
jgi:hypothetical protein